MNIALFFTLGYSLKAWKQAFLLNRDTLLYRRLQDLGHRVCFVTYGSADTEKSLGDALGIGTLGKPRKLPYRLYKWMIPLVHYSELAGVDVIKSHQIRGFRYAVWAKRLLRKKYMARCGYVLSAQSKERRFTRSELKAVVAEERLGFQSADAICVPSQMEAEYVSDKYGIKLDRIHICPNWIDTELFRPSNEPKDNRAFRICFVARYEENKQPLMVIDAVRGLADVELLMIGGGPLKPTILVEMERTGVRGTVLGRVPNENLPDYLNSCDVYVLPTLIEGGSPKTLLEAMSCELPVVSTNCFGVNEAFEHEVHGLKIEPKVEMLRNAIVALMEDADLRRSLGRRGREHVLTNYSIDPAVEREIEVLSSLV